jgi:hypothetical protein
MPDAVAAGWHGVGRNVSVHRLRLAQGWESEHLNA